MPDELNQARLERIAAVMLRHDVKFIVIGGQAEFLFGSPRATFDVDLCYERSRGNLDRMAKALVEIGATLRGAPTGLPFIVDARTLAMGMNFTFATPFGDLDILGCVEPIGEFQHLDIRAGDWEVGGRTLRVIDLDDLIRIKRHINRLKDQSSLVQLLAIKRIRDEGRDVSR